MVDDIYIFVPYVYTVGYTYCWVFLFSKL